MIIDYQLSGNGDDTILTLTHSNVLRADRQAMMSQVWDFLLECLKNHIETKVRYSAAVIRQ